MSEIIFEVTEDEASGGYSASALGYAIHTQGESIEDVCRNVKEAVDRYFDETMTRPRLIRLYWTATTRSPSPATATAAVSGRAASSTCKA